MNIRSLNSLTASERLGLRALLRDSVEQGASVGYVLPVSEADMESFWDGVMEDATQGSRVVLVLEDDAGIAASAQLSLCAKPNSLHRAEVQKVLVHSRAQRRGHGRALMLAIEDAARKAGRTLLVLDTETGSKGQLLYQALGYQVAGIIPGFALANDGDGAVPTTYMYKMI